jgi:peptidoglycan/xylan/chitin deacetylase (PgdA/CDA1 family)
VSAIPLTWRAAALMGRIVSPSGTRGRLSILIFHRVLPQADAMYPGTPDAPAFDRLMASLAEHCSVLPLADGIERLQRGRLPARAVSITFDDGYRDNAEYALPVLRRHGLSATFFIAPGFLDGGRMWNDTVIEAVRLAQGPLWDLSRLGLERHWVRSPEERRHAAGRLIRALKYRDASERDVLANAVAEACGAELPRHLMMDSAQLGELHQAGMAIGGHTVSHPILTRLGREEARREIHEGKQRLEDLLRAPVSLFAYPNGKPGEDYGAEHVALVREAGFRAAVSTAWGSARRDTDVYQLPRFTPWDRDPGRFLARLWFNCLRTHAAEGRG